MVYLSGTGSPRSKGRYTGLSLSDAKWRQIELYVAITQLQIKYGDSFLAYHHMLGTDWQSLQLAFEHDDVTGENGGSTESDGVGIDADCGGTGGACTDGNGTTANGGGTGSDSGGMEAFLNPV